MRRSSVKKAALRAGGNIDNLKREGGSEKGPPKNRKIPPRKPKGATAHSMAVIDRAGKSMLAAPSEFRKNASTEPDAI